MGRENHGTFVRFFAVSAQQTTVTSHARLSIGEFHRSPRRRRHVSILPPYNLSVFVLVSFLSFPNRKHTASDESNISKLFSTHATPELNRACRLSRMYTMKSRPCTRTFYTAHRFKVGSCFVRKCNTRCFCLDMQAKLMLRTSHGGRIIASFSGFPF